MTQGMPNDEHLAVLETLEMNLSEYYAQNPQLIDIDVADAFHALVRHYKLRLENRSFNPNLKGRSKEVFEMLQTLADIFVSNGLYPVEDSSLETMQHYTLEDMLLCFKRLESSLKFWNKEGGRQGYLNYISQFQ
jgi:hypothetical protein